MAVSKKDLLNWLETLPEEALIAIDDGGLVLLASQDGGLFPYDSYGSYEGDYLEIGVVPEE